jgi:hypothetical protein
MLFQRINSCFVALLLDLSDILSGGARGGGHRTYLSPHRRPPVAQRYFVNVAMFVHFVIRPRWKFFAQPVAPQQRMSSAASGYVRVFQLSIALGLLITIILQC